MSFVLKRKNIAIKMIDVATAIVDYNNALKQLNAEYTAMSSPFVDGDFTSDDLKHLDAYTAEAMISIVGPAINTTIVDAGNGNFNQNILLKVRR